MTHFQASAPDCSSPVIAAGAIDAAGGALPSEVPSEQHHGGGVACGAASPDAASPVSSGQPQDVDAGSPQAPDGAAPLPTKVALFIEPSPFCHVSGMKIRFETHIRELGRQGVKALVFVPDCGRPPSEYHGARVFNVLGFALPFYKAPTLLLSLATSARVVWQLVAHRPDVIHVTTPGCMFLAATLYARALRIPLVISYHTHIPMYIPKYTWGGLVAPMWAIIRWCTRAADLTLVTSRVIKEEFRSQRCPVGAVDVWQRAVDTELFHPRWRSAAMRARMMSASGGGGGGDPAGAAAAPLLVFVGRLGVEKSLLDLVPVLKANPGARLALVGDGPQREELEERFAEAGLPVTFMGMLSGEELSAAYASADIFVMPSESETLGFVVLEAMASGLPVVSVAAGGLVDIINRPGETGLLYPAGDLAAAADQVRRLISDPDLAKRMGAAARAEAESLGWSASTRRVREQYAAAVSSWRQSSQRAPLHLRVASLASLGLMCTLSCLIVPTLSLLLGQVSALIALILTARRQTAHYSAVAAAAARPLVKRLLLAPWRALRSLRAAATGRAAAVVTARQQQGQGQRSPGDGGTDTNRRPRSRRVAAFAAAATRPR